MKPEANQALPTVTFRADWPRRSILYVMAGFLGALPLMAFSLVDKDPVGPAFLLAMLLSPAIGLLMYFDRYTRLVVSDQGICLRNPGMSHTANWQNIRRIDINSFAVGVVLQAPSDTPATLRMKSAARSTFNRSSVYTPDQQQLIAQGRFIDLRAFSRQLRSEDFLKQLRLIAPLVAEASIVAPVERPPPTTGLQWLIITGIVMVPMFIGVLLGMLQA